MPETNERSGLSAAEIGALAHLYRGEVYRSTTWRTRLDTTTNWSVVTLGIALSIAFASPQASPLPLVLVGVLIIFFLMLEARRYRFFNVWRARCRWLERHFFAPMLHDMLTRHEVRHRLSVLPRTGSGSAGTLLQFARENGSEMIVMGAYGHSRLREAILGGTTRDMLADTHLPLILAR